MMLRFLVKIMCCLFSFTYFQPLSMAAAEVPSPDMKDLYLSADGKACIDFYKKYYTFNKSTLKDTIRRHPAKAAVAATALAAASIATLTFPIAAPITGSIVATMLVTTETGIGAAAIMGVQKTFMESSTQFGKLIESAYVYLGLSSEKTPGTSEKLLKHYFEKDYFKRKKFLDGLNITINLEDYARNIARANEAGKLCPATAFGNPQQNEETKNYVLGSHTPFLGNIFSSKRKHIDYLLTLKTTDEELYTARQLFQNDLAE